MKHTILVFLRFGQEHHIMDLYENGTIYLNTVEYFRGLKDTGFRGDPYEGISRIINVSKGSFLIPSLNHTVDYQNLHAKSNDVYVGNLYCLYAISSKTIPDPATYKMDSKNLDFGTHCLIIKQPGTFLQKVENALKKASYKFEDGFVEYYDMLKFSGKRSPFHKSLEYKHQNEFRFFVDNLNNKPITLNIGSMKTYSQVVKLEDMMSLELKGNDSRTS